MSGSFHTGSIVRTPVNVASCVGHKGFFDSVFASLREANTPLRMTFTNKIRTVNLVDTIASS